MAKAKSAVAKAKAAFNRPLMQPPPKATTPGSIESVTNTEKAKAVTSRETLLARLRGMVGKQVSVPKKASSQVVNDEEESEEDENEEEDDDEDED